MLQEVLWMHSRINKNECMRIVLTVKGWEIHCDKTDLVGEFNGCLRIVRANGRIVTINPEQIVMVCTMNKESVLL